MVHGGLTGQGYEKGYDLGTYTSSTLFEVRINRIQGTVEVNHAAP